MTLFKQIDGGASDVGLVGERAADKGTEAVSQQAQRVGHWLGGLTPVQWFQEQAELQRLSNEVAALEAQEAKENKG